MAYETKPNSFALFTNNYKQKDTQPDYRGTLTDADGKEWDMAGWKLQTKNGDTFLAGQISDREENKKKYGDKKADSKGQQREEEDDLPF